MLGSHSPEGTNSNPSGNILNEPGTQLSGAAVLVTRKNSFAVDAGSSSRVNRTLMRVPVSTPTAPVLGNVPAESTANAPTTRSITLNESPPDTPLPLVTDTQYVPGFTGL